MTADAQFAYAGFGQKVRRLDRVGGVQNVVSADVVGIDAIAVSGNEIYLASGSRVMTLPTAFAAGQTPASLHDYGSGATVTAIRATSTAVFVATEGSNGGTIHVLPPAGGSGMTAVVVRSPDAECKLPAMDEDSTSIFFLCNSAAGVGSVWRVAKPAP